MKDYIIDPILEEVKQERIRQDLKWGEQNHPSVDLTLNSRHPYPSDRMCEEYEIPTESRAKFLCENSFTDNHGTWAHILVEEVSETISSPNEELRREELIQLIAVAVAWVESIDRNLK